MGSRRVDAAAKPAGNFALSGEQKAFLDVLQRDTFRYFWETTPANGLTPDRSGGRPATLSRAASPAGSARDPAQDISSVAAVGFALTSYALGVERGYVTRAQASQRTLATLRTLWEAPQGAQSAGVAGYHGFFYHFLDPRTGWRFGNCELSTIDTALLMAGVLSARDYFDGTDATEVAIRNVAEDLYRRVDWPWAYSRRHPPLLTMGWSPEGGYLDADWAGYNEGMLLYLLALGSPTHPIENRAWNDWTNTYSWDEQNQQPHVSFGPLFGHQYSHVWVDFRGIQDEYMRSRGIDYFINSARATYANRAYCMANPEKWVGYDGEIWGLTASDGPSKPGLESPGDFHSYWARGAAAGYVHDDGTIAPTAAGGSVPFAPEVTIPTLLQFRARFGERLYGQYGFKDAFNLSFPNRGHDNPGWFDDEYIAIDQGPILLMIENYRTGFVWQLMKRDPYLRAGLERAGFSGGWLAPAPVSTSQ